MSEISLHPIFLPEGISDEAKEISTDILSKLSTGNRISKTYSDNTVLQEVLDCLCNSICAIHPDFMHLIDFWDSNQHGIGVCQPEDPFLSIRAKVDDKVSMRELSNQIYDRWMDIEGISIYAPQSSSIWYDIRIFFDDITPDIQDASGTEIWLIKNRKEEDMDATKTKV